MRVDLIAYTVTDNEAIYSALGFVKNDLETADPDHLAETAGRLCYLSFDRPNPKTRENKDYLGNVLSQGHESVVSHPSASFIIQGVSRNLTHEMIRSRFLAFSELSQRYVDAIDLEFITPPACEGVGDLNEGFLSDLSKTAYRTVVDDLVAHGATRKQAREAARSVLLSSAETKIVASGNLRAWRDFIKQRLTKFADAEIQALAYKILVDLLEYAPNTFQDIAYLAEEYEDRN